MIGVEHIALRDISQWINEMFSSSEKKFIVTREYLESKETRMLNRQLELHKVNKQDLAKNFKK